MQGRGLRIVTLLIAVTAAVWHFRVVAQAASSSSPGRFPFVPAIIAAGSTMLAAYAWFGGPTGDD